MYPIGPEHEYCRQLLANKDAELKSAYEGWRKAGFKAWLRDPDENGIIQELTTKLEKTYDALIRIRHICTLCNLSKEAVVIIDKTLEESEYLKGE